MSGQNASIGIYASQTEVEAIIRKLQRCGFDLNKLSILARDRRDEGRTAGYYLRDGRMKYWGSRSAFWDRIWGLLPQWAFLDIPDLGPVLVAGPLAGWVLAALENEAVFPRLNAVEAALYSIGLPPAAMRECEAGLKSGKFVMLAHGTSEEVIKARNVLGNTLETILQ